jgi:hypothetical protein
MKLGKTPARKGAVKFALMNYVDWVLPTPPAEFGYEDRIKTWGVLGNDDYGDCVLAAAAHDTMLWGALGAHPVEFTDDGVLSDYSVVTGFNINDPSTDQGTDMQAAASYRLKVGVVDSKGVRHRIGAYVSVEPGNVEQHKAAAWLFGAIDIGIMLSDLQMHQTRAGEPWSGKLTRNIGGHCVPLVGFKDGYLLVISWGEVQRVDPAFFEAYNDESIAYFSQEMINRGAGPAGTYVWRLNQDLKAIAKR